MLVLLPPSEGKTAPRRGAPLNLESMTAPELTAGRAAALDALVELCRADPIKAADVLDLGPTQYDEIARNATLPTAPTAVAAKVYTGVLYATLDPATITGPAKRRLNRWVLVQSALFGLVGMGDRIPAYRLSGDVSLPGVGTMASHWRTSMRSVLPTLARRGLVVDLRSTTYAAFWRGDHRTVTLRVLQEVSGRRMVVSHFNKATKGRIVRALVTDGGTPRNAHELVEHLGALGWQAEQQSPRQVDVVVAEL
ncbi:MAG: peroxide stress protein YaaA [Propionibacteriales bacterium]|nr:peroxide stress protein YaaA [Propionibacteriales bacterium]